MTFVPDKFDVDSTIELVADHWNASSPDTVLFRNAAPSDRMDLSAGLITPSGVDVIVAVVDGVIDEYQIAFTPNSVVQNVRGRDASAKALDTYVNIQFRKGPPVPVIEQAGTPATTDIRYGSWTAISIAQAVVAAAGLTLSWEVRDYTLLEAAFGAQGRVIDVLRRLIEPWSIVSPFAPDIFLRGTQMIVAHRVTPGAIGFVADSTFNALEAKRSGITVRLRRLRKFGRVILTGARDLASGGLTSTPVGQEGGFTFGSGTHTVEETSEKFNAAEQLISRIVTTTTYRTPDRIPITIIRSTYTKPASGPLTLTNRETIEVDLEPSVYNDQGPVNSPKTLGKVTTVEGEDPTDEIFKVVSEEILDYQYDSLGFMKFEGALKRGLDPTTHALVDQTLVEKTYSDSGALDVTQIVEKFVFDTDKQRWRRTDRDETRSGGHRAGGPNRGQSTAGLGAGEAGNTILKNFVVDQVISSDVDALPFSYQNANLSLADLNFLMTLFQAASGMKEYEIMLQGVAIPWIRRSNVVKITGLVLEDGITMLDLLPAKITEVKMTYDESKAQAEFMMPTVRAFAWAPA